MTTPEISYILLMFSDTVIPTKIGIQFFEHALDAGSSPA